jgi:hypothetical protein
MNRRYLDWPLEVSIETLAKCNAACVFCPYPTLDRQGEKMPDEMLDRIVEELKDHPHPFIVSPFKVNEPFLDKRLLPFCRKVMAELPNAMLRLFSNGSALTGKNLCEVDQLERVYHLWISLNTHDPAEYKRVMSLDFDRTTANLDSLHVMKEHGAFRHPVVLSKVMEHAVRELVDEAFIAYCRDRWPLFEVFTIKRDSWLGNVEIDARPIPDAPCGRWQELSITATGVVSLCCMDGKAEHPIGDLRTQSLFEVYNSREYRERRVKNLSRLEVPVCSGCNY